MLRRCQEHTGTNPPGMRWPSQGTCWSPRSVSGAPSMNQDREAAPVNANLSEAPRQLVLNSQGSATAAAHNVDGAQVIRSVTINVFLTASTVSRILQLHRFGYGDAQVRQTWETNTFSLESKGRWSRMSALPCKSQTVKFSSDTHHFRSIAGNSLRDNGPAFLDVFRSSDIDLAASRCLMAVVRVVICVSRQ